MKTCTMLVAACALLVLAIGCSSTATSENMLMAAGFKTLPADTPDREAHLNSLPADTITPVQRDGTIYYTYPDPKQKVLYVGQEAQYREYLRLRLQKQIADEQLEAAQMNQGDASAWELWGQWGEPGWARQ